MLKAGFSSSDSFVIDIPLSSIQRPVKIIYFDLSMSLNITW